LPSINPIAGGGKKKKKEQVNVSIIKRGKIKKEGGEEGGAKGNYPHLLSLFY